MLSLDAAGAEVSARTLVPSPPACAALEGATFAGTRCYNGSRMDHRFYQAATDRHVVTTWAAEVWTTLPGDPSGDWIIDHVGFAGFTHW